MKRKLKKVVQLSLLMSLIGLGNTTVYAVSCWNGACIVKQNDTLLQIAQAMEKSTQAIAAGKPLEQPRDISSENMVAIETKESEIKYDTEDIFDSQAEDDLLWQSKNQFDEPEYQDDAIDVPVSKTETTSTANTTATKKTYTVQVGDTLFSVMRKSKVHWRLLAQLNQLNPPYSLTVGQVLKLSAN